MMDGMKIPQSHNNMQGKHRGVVRRPHTGHRMGHMYAVGLGLTLKPICEMCVICVPIWEQRFLSIISALRE